MIIMQMEGARRVGKRSRRVVGVVTATYTNRRATGVIFPPSDLLRNCRHRRSGTDHLSRTRIRLAWRDGRSCR